MQSKVAELEPVVQPPTLTPDYSIQLNLFQSTLIQVNSIMC